MSQNPTSAKNNKGALLFIVLCATLFWLSNSPVFNPSSTVVDKSSELAQLKHRYAIDMDKGKTDDAIKELTRGIELDPHNPVPLRLRGSLYEQSGDLKAAASDLDRALLLQPADVDTLMAIAALQYKSKNYDQALLTYDKLTNLKGDKRAQVVGLNGKALVHLSLDHPDLAQRQVKEAIALDPFSVKAREIMGNVLQKRGDLRGAIDSYTAGLRIDRSSYGLYNNRALAYKKLNMYSECVADLEALTRLKPQDKVLAERLAKVKAESKAQTK
ncbi:MAG: tetratricopeptide repeat protein [Candidatus Obscuribacter sp.]|nr:tetratricopeptide repeat protein [Candidatus Obscuribacter sp.]